MGTTNTASTVIADEVYAEAFLLESLYSARSHVEALKWALKQDMDRLQDMAFLCGTSEDGDRHTLAFRVVVVGRHLDEDEHAALSKWCAEQLTAKRAAAAAHN